MTEHTFDLAASLVDKAIERLDRRDYGITRILVHEFGQFPLCANHTVHDTGHTIMMWAYDDAGLVAAAEASAPHVGGTPQGRIISFRAAHLTFGALDDDTTGTTFFARGRSDYYLLTALTASSEWTVAAGRLDEDPDRFTGIDDALHHILSELEPLTAA